MDLGPHSAFIWLSYFAVLFAVGGLIAWLFTESRRHEQHLADLEARGVRRRSSSAGNENATS